MQHTNGILTTRTIQPSSVGWLNTIPQHTVDKKELIPLVEADRAKKAAEEKALAQRIRRQSIRRFAKRLTKGRQNTTTQELQEIEELVTKYGNLGVIGARLIFF